MSDLPVVFQRVARNEFDDAADWYEQRRPGRGPLFTAAVRAVLDRIVDQPDFYPTALDDIREAVVSGYPYCVYYRIEAQRILILAVFHTARDPSIWQGRS